MMQFSADTKLYGSTPMLMKRPITSVTLFACTVVKTKWPVREDWVGIFAVFWARFLRPLDFVDGGVQRGGLARTRWSGHQHHAIGFADIPAEFTHLFPGKTHDIEAE